MSEKANIYFRSSIKSGKREPRARVKGRQDSLSKYLKHKIKTYLAIKLQVSKSFTYGRWTPRTKPSSWLLAAPAFPFQPHVFKVSGPSMESIVELWCDDQTTGGSECGKAAA